MVKILKIVLVILLSNYVGVTRLKILKVYIYICLCVICVCVWGGA